MQRHARSVAEGIRTKLAAEKGANQGSRRRRRRRSRRRRRRGTGSLLREEEVQQRARETVRETKSLN